MKKMHAVYLIFGVFIVFVATAQSQSEALVTALAWNQDGSYLAVGRQDDTLEIWDDENTLLVSQNDLNVSINSICWSPTEPNLLAVGDRNGRVTIWELTDNKLGINLQIESGQNRIMEITWSPDGSTIAGIGELGRASSTKSSVQVWDAVEGRHLSTYQDGNILTDIAWRPSEATELLITGVADHYGAQITLWDIEDGVIWSEQDSDAGVLYLAWNPDGSQFAVLRNGIGSSDPTASARIQLHEANSGQLLTSFNTGFSYSTTMIWQPDEKIALSGWDRIGVVDIAEKKVLPIVIDGFVDQIAWSINGDLVYSVDSTIGIIKDSEIPK